MFQEASRIKLRFATTVGNISVEDLWDLKLSSLDGLAQCLHKQIKDETVSFIKEVKEEDTIPKLKFDIVKQVIDVRLEEIDAAKNAALIKEKKQHILRIIADKESESLQETSLDELKKMLEEL